MSFHQLPIVKGMSRRSIEQYSVRFLMDAYPHVLSEPQPLPIIEVLRFDLQIHREIEFELDFLGGSGIEGITIPGDPVRMVFDNFVFNRMKLGNVHARFTGAHEAGHGIIHGPQLRERIVSGTNLGLARRSDLRIFENPEWQANKFAGYLLIPSAALEVAITKLGLNISRLADIFKVSPMAMKVRLDDRQRDLETKSPTR